MKTKRLFIQTGTVVNISEAADGSVHLSQYRGSTQSSAEGLCFVWEPGLNLCCRVPQSPVRLWAGLSYSVYVRAKSRS